VLARGRGVDCLGQRCSNWDRERGPGLLLGVMWSMPLRAFPPPDPDNVDAAQGHTDQTREREPVLAAERVGRLEGSDVVFAPGAESRPLMGTFTRMPAGDHLPLDDRRFYPSKRIR
jgi:hypothetical protein